MGEWLRVNHTLNQRVLLGDQQGGGKSLCGSVPRGDYQISQAPKYTVDPQAMSLTLLQFPLHLSEA